MGRVDRRAAADRATSRAPGRLTRHHFSFGAHFDPANVRLGPLVAVNDERLEAGAGYPDHEHRELDIATWVLEGELHHHDAPGHDAVVTPGRVQVLRSGSGVVHAEHAGTAPVRFVQSWLLSDEPTAAASYAVADAGTGTGLVPLASGLPGVEAPVRLSAAAALYVARPAPDVEVALPDGTVFVVQTRGEAALGPGEPLAAGDDVRIRDGRGLSLRSTAVAEALVWQLAGPG